MAGDPGMRHGGPRRVPERRVRCRKYTGYAFGMGIERIGRSCGTGSTIIRLFFQNDVRFLNQF